MISDVLVAEMHNQAIEPRMGFQMAGLARTEHRVTTAMKLVCAGEDQRVVGIHLVGDNVDEELPACAVLSQLANIARLPRSSHLTSCPR